MERKNTDQLQQELMTGNDLSRVLSDNDASFQQHDLQETLQALFERRSISKTMLAKQSGISEVYLHQVFSGRRTPSRNRLLCLCFGLEATVDETQELLRHARFAPLYSRARRAAILIFGLSHNMTLAQVNDKLYDENVDTLC